MSDDFFPRNDSEQKISSNEEHRGRRVISLVQHFFVLCYTYVKSCAYLKKETERKTDSKKSTGKSKEGVDQMEGKEDSALVFTLDQILRATGNFSLSLEVGRGAFGVVYKGKLPDGTLVAIKRAKKGTLEVVTTTEFLTEINLLADADHLNLVKLLGYVDEGGELILVEEFVANGNLRQHLDCKFGKVLDLSIRLDIAIDVAHALAYLHNYADRPIIHRDIKSTNILLTEKFRVKVADFGFSLVGSLQSSVLHVEAEVKGTAGYLDPEYLSTAQLTPKSDVYSFGITLIELITGRRPLDRSRSMEEWITFRWAFKKYIDGDIKGLLDPNIPHTKGSLFVCEKVLVLAFQCAAPTKDARPTATVVAQLLWSIRKEYQDLLQERQDALFYP